MKESFFPGTVLREQREALGYSVEDVSCKTHIPIQHILAFEAGTFDAMPGRAYAIGFLRSYCRFIGLDPEPFCDHYLLCTQTTRTSNPFRFIRRFDKSGKVEYVSPQWMTELINWATVCFIVLLAWMAYAVVIRPLADTIKDRVEAGSVEIEVPVHFNEDL